MGGGMGYERGSSRVRVRYVKVRVRVRVRGVIWVRVASSMCSSFRTLSMVRIRDERSSTRLRVRDSQG